MGLEGREKRRNKERKKKRKMGENLILLTAEENAKKNQIS